jgi:hypothetical protein
MKKIFVLTASFCATVALAQSAPRVGEFLIQNPGGPIELIRDRKSGTLQATLTGPSLSLKSTYLTLAARKIWVRATPSGPKKTYRVTNATATGGVQITRHDDKSGQTDRISCERAELKAGSAPRSGHIDLGGKVVWKTFDKALGVVQQLSGEGGSIDFDDGGETIRLSNLDGTLAPPAPKDKGKL